MTTTQITTNTELLKLATELVRAAECVALVLKDNSEGGLCISDLQFVLHELRPMVRKVEILAGEHKD